MSLREKIGQMLIMGFAGCELDPSNPVVDWLLKDGLGGVLLFDYDIAAGCQGKNLRDCEQIKRLTRQLNEYADARKSKNDQSPLLIAIDYEGGAVDRLAKIPGCYRTLSASEQASLPEDQLYKEILRMAVTLRDLGFNLNFAPVLDLNLDQAQGIIGKLGRSFSNNPAMVIRIAKKFVSIFAQEGIACAYKHFPGHGSAAGDTHQGFVDVTDSYQNKELEPYQMLLKDKMTAVMVMTAHVIHRKLDPSGLPATLSKTILTGLLREEMGFNGVIVSDDLQMHAISAHFSLDDAIALTINAGADMMIFGNQLGYHAASEIIDRIEQMVLSGLIPNQRIEESYQRILRLKRQTAHTTVNL